MTPGRASLYIWRCVAGSRVCRVVAADWHEARRLAAPLLGISAERGCSCEVEAPVQREFTW